MKITSFTGKYEFLSNFYRLDMLYDKRIWPSVEHAFQAMKSINPIVQERIRTTQSCKEAKRRGRSVLLRKDWEQIKVSIMSDILYVKFQNPDLRKMLIQTLTKELIEGNYHHDNYWGVCNCSKCKYKSRLNMLGKLLMIVRKCCVDGDIVDIMENQLAILDHTVHRAANNQYCGDSSDMRKLVN